MFFLCFFFFLPSGGVYTVCGAQPHFCVAAPILWRLVLNARMAPSKSFTHKSHHYHENQGASLLGREPARKQARE